ncbi:recombination protein F [Altererythrobacter aurantiacus]|uniref:Recombination protein F n=1 Tax=Parapontixanthobacter aurantiacus TaxID=1463599 RepID=A0A844ZJ96_9SPHN|nr:recombination protein F [Parapontixanthobacter aurantiacus]MXO85769.1 recombination protein F [Parapontixanthobacter aurantiacus]
MFSFNDYSSKLVAAVSSLAISALFFAVAIAPAVPNAAGSGMLA